MRVALGDTHARDERCQAWFNVVGCVCVTTRHHVSTASPRDSRHSVQAHPLIPWDQRDDAIDQLRDREHQMTKFYCLIAAAAMFVPMVMATLNQAAMIVA